MNSRTVRFVPLAVMRLASKWPTIVVGALLVLGTGCGVDPATLWAGEATELLQGSDVTRAALQAAIQRSAQYLVKACDAQGQFSYCINLDPSIKVEAQYNVLRHAGTVYALAQYCHRAADPVAKEALLRAARFLKQRCVAPAAGNPRFLAVWSEPDLIGGDQPRQAKLGGTGLGLAALLSVERVEPGFTSVDELRRLGRFLIFMQKSDGSFYSRFFPKTGRSDMWYSMYYPGEAALGLLMLYARDPSEQWLHTATKALENLARRGALQDPTLPDQWYLLALERWAASAHEGNNVAAGARLLEHARRLCRDMVREQQQQLDVAQIRGCFTPEGRTCPSATRLEGLIAAISYLPPEDETLRRDVYVAVERGLLFLMRSQVIEGPYAGALPRFSPGFHPPEVSSAEKLRLQEVRIDYVQHALSAMIAYERESFSQSSHRSDRTSATAEDR